MPDHALDDVDVIDLGQIYNGAYCSLILSYLGADVTKVEPPFGEPLRSRVEDGEPPEFVMLNSSKDGITLNLKSKRGREIFKTLIKDADVLVENFGVGTMAEFGLGYETLSEINPELIYARGSGFGEEGPRSEQLAMDLVVQAAGGVMDVTGFPDSPPVKTGIAPGDFLGGTHLVAGVLTALYEREQTGNGQFVEASMYDAVYPSLLSQLGSYYRDEDVSSRTGNRHSGLSKAPYNAYKASNGYVTILCASDEHWRRLLDAIGKSELIQKEEYATNVRRLKHMKEIDDIIETWTADRSQQSIEDRMRDAGVPCSAVQTVEEVIHDPHLEQRHMVEEIDHPAMEEPIRVPGTPIRLSDSELPDIEPSPTKGQDNYEVLTERLGLSEDEIQELEEDGII